MASTDELVLYVDGLSQPSRAAMSLVFACDLPVRIQLVRLTHGEHLTAEFKRLNVMRQVPVLRHGKFALPEAHALMRYLCRLFPDKVASHWYPSDAKGAARVDRVLDWHHTNLRYGAARLVFATVLGPRMGIDISPPSGREARILPKSLRVLNGWLAAAPYVAGGSKPSIADLALAAELKQMQLLPEEYPLPEHVREWLTRMEALPSFAKAHRTFEKARAKLVPSRAKL
eukprot:PLAT9471.1.p1 GENE.PLAT9471.1~~PLAT9471.1.p1  ORF type:complete len:229 (+),score=96.08 PLAT9471.1:80-766(+)